MYPDNIRAAFREVALGLMEWQELPDDPPYEEAPVRYWKPADKQGQVEPFDIDADWEERA